MDQEEEKCPKTAYGKGPSLPGGELKMGLRGSLGSSAGSLLLAAFMGSDACVITDVLKLTSRSFPCPVRHRMCVQFRLSP